MRKTGTSRGTFKRYSPHPAVYVLFPWIAIFRVFRLERLVAVSIFLLLLATAILFLNQWQLTITEPDAFFLLSISGFIAAYMCFAPMTNRGLRDRWTLKATSFDFAVPPLVPIGVLGSLTGLYGLTQAILVLLKSPISLAHPVVYVATLGIMLISYLGALVFLYQKRKTKSSRADRRYARQRKHVQELSHDYSEKPHAEDEEQEDVYSEEDYTGYEDAGHSETYQEDEDGEALYEDDPQYR